MTTEIAARRRWTDRFTPSQRALELANHGLQLVMVLLLAWMVYLTIWPRHGLVIETPTVAEPQRVRAGEIVTLSITYSKVSEGASDLGLFLASKGRIVVLPTATIALPAGQHRVAVIVPVPAYTPPGSYKVYVVRETRASYFPKPPILVESTVIEVVP